MADEVVEAEVDEGGYPLRSVVIRQTIRTSALTMMRSTNRGIARWKVSYLTPKVHFDVS